MNICTTCKRAVAEGAGVVTTLGFCCGRCAATGAPIRLKAHHVEHDGDDLLFTCSACGGQCPDDDVVLDNPFTICASCAGRVAQAFKQYEARS